MTIPKKMMKKKRHSEYIGLSVYLLYVWNDGMLTFRFLTTYQGKRIRLRSLPWIYENVPALYAEVKVTILDSLSDSLSSAIKHYLTNV